METGKDYQECATRYQGMQRLLEGAQAELAKAALTQMKPKQKHKKEAGFRLLTKQLGIGNKYCSKQM